MLRVGTGGKCRLPCSPTFITEANKGKKVIELFTDGPGSPWEPGNRGGASMYAFPGRAWEREGQSEKPRYLRLPLRLHQGVSYVTVTA